MVYILYSIPLWLKCHAPKFMATYNNGPLGGFSGKLGPIVGTTWRGKNVLRTLPSKSEKPPSMAQELQRSKLKVTMQFLTPIRSLLKSTFKRNIRDKGGFDSAKSYFMKEALQFSESGWEINYPKVLISMGDLRGLANPEISVEAEEILHLQWTNDSGQAMANASDKLLVVIYLPVLHQFEIFETSATRQDTHAHIPYPSYYIGLEAQCWVTFGTFNAGKYAVSTYLGEVRL